MILDDLVFLVCCGRFYMVGANKEASVQPQALWTNTWPWLIQGWRGSQTLKEFIKARGVHACIAGCMRTANYRSSIKAWAEPEHLQFSQQLADPKREKVRLTK
jgi:hypothetical protein